MGIVDNFRSSLQRLVFGRSYQDCLNDLEKEKNKNSRLNKEIQSLKIKLEAEKLKSKELRKRIEDITQDRKRISNNKNQEIELKIYYSLLGEDNSTASFEFDIKGIVDISFTESQIVNKLTESSFFDDLMSLYDMNSSIDSSMANLNRTSGLTTRLIDKESSDTLQVDFVIRSKRDNDRGMQKIKNPLKF